MPSEHKCSRLHGHSYQVQVHAKGPLKDQTGWVTDFATHQRG
ncbi:6-pyruvoyl trahydropterin synthase family protein [Mycolicibacterium goodii]